MESKYARFTFVEFEPADDEIGRLYRELEDIESLLADRPGDAGLGTQRREALARLRELQTEEARRMRADIAGQLDSPVGSGKQLRKEADEFLAAHGHPPRNDPPAGGAHSPSA